MKDNISLIAAAAGGFMLSVALAGILHGAPVTTWREQASSNAPMATSVSVAPKQTHNTEILAGEAQKS